MTLKTNYKDYVASGNKKIKLNSVGNGVYEVTDSTTYTQTGDNIGATDLNNITTAVNTANTNISSVTSTVNKIKPTVRSNIAVSVTPTAISSYNTWDTKKAYGYKATVTVSGLTANSMIQNIVLSDTVLSSIAPVVTTAANSLIFYTKNATVLSGTIVTLVTNEVA